MLEYNIVLITEVLEVDKKIIMLWIILVFFLLSCCLKQSVLLLLQQESTCVIETQITKKCMSFALKDSLFLSFWRLKPSVWWIVASF